MNPIVQWQAIKYCIICYIISKTSGTTLYGALVENSFDNENENKYKMIHNTIFSPKYCNDYSFLLIFFFP